VSSAAFEPRGVAPAASLAQRDGPLAAYLSVDTGARPDHVAILDATVGVSAHESLYLGDIDLTLAEPHLARSARMLDRPLFVHEPSELPGIPRRLASPPVYTIRPDGGCSFDERIAYRAADGTLRRRGVRPYRHPPNRLAAWVFGQHQVWVDRHGHEHEIESMPRGYQRNLIWFCHRHAKRIRQIVTSDEMFEALEMIILTDEIERGFTLLEQITFAYDTDAKSWLERTPLMRAMRRQLEPCRHAEPGAHP
jgi:hypothetical protein